MEREVLIECQKICKSFGPTRALINVDIEVRRGDVCGLIGENGSGKSTLTSIIAGAQTADSGMMLMKGKEYSPTSMLHGQQCGVSMIVQETGTLPGLTVASNVFVGGIERFRRHGLIDMKQLNHEAEVILAEIGAADISATAMIDTLNFEDRKIVEIARAMYLKPEILIVDESTTALGQKGRTIIYNLIRKMQSENKAVIFISHDLDELLEVCNTITVLRDGRKIENLTEEQMSIAAMRRLMVGRELSDHYFRSDYDGSFEDEVLLSADRISSEDGMILNLDLKLHKGEILGIGGLANSGMHELGKMLFGISKPVTGKVVYEKNGVVLKDPIVSIRNRVGYISKDRDTESLILNASIRDNIALPSLGRLARHFLISDREEKQLSDDQIRQLSIKCIDGSQLCTELSGGNKQKVALAKWLGYDCDILIMDCPTRGIDIGVKAAMYDIMYELKKRGKAILMISEELVELIGMSDRILIMKDGRISSEFERSETLTESMIIEHMI